jgi:hypothetical protein
LRMASNSLHGEESLPKPSRVDTIARHDNIMDIFIL